MEALISADNGVDLTLGLQFAVNILHKVLTAEHINLIDASGI